MPYQPNLNLTSLPMHPHIDYTDTSVDLFGESTPIDPTLPKRAPGTIRYKEARIYDKPSITEQIRAARSEGELEQIVAWANANTNNLSTKTVKRMNRAVEVRYHELRQQAKRNAAIRLLSNQS